MSPDMTVSWRDYVDSRFEAAERAVNAALTAQGRLVDAAFASSEKAIDKAEDAQKQRDAKANEFRGQLDDQARTFITKDAVDRVETDIDRRIEVLESANSRQQGALAVARFVGFGGLLAGLSALVYSIVNSPVPVR